jgi:surfactin synthase thioesterase subunit
MHGRDRMTSYELAKELQRGIADAKLVTVDGGHFAFLTTARTRLVAEVSNFVQA